MHAVLIWRDIGNYHAARSRAVGRLASMKVTTLEVRSEAQFADFRAGADTRGTFLLRGLGLNEGVGCRTVARALTAALEELGPDVVFVPGWSMVEALVALEWCAINGTAAVIMSDSICGGDARSFAKEAVKRLVVSLGGAALVAGQRSAEYIVSLGMRPERCFFGYDTIDNAHFAAGALATRSDAAAVREALALPERYLLCCARLIPEKNLPNMLEAYRLYRSRVGESALPLVLVGPGPLDSEIKRIAANVGLSPYVHLKGAQVYGAMPSFYALAEAVILPSVSETWGLVINEAMACGTPVLVSERCGCAPDLVREGENGFLFDPLDVQGMADAIARVVSPDCDRAAMGRAGQAIIDDWGLDRFVAGFEAAAKAALSAPRKSVSLTDRAILKALAMR